MLSTILDKADIIDQLGKAFQKVYDLVHQQDLTQYHEPLEAGKWSMAQQIDHLIRSTAPLNNGLRMPKPALQSMFGKCERVEKSFEELVQDYENMLANGAQALGRYVPSEAPEYPKEVSLHKLKQEVNQLIEALDKWDEKRLSKYQIPHPILGKLTVREILYFTIHHTLHHAQAIQRGL